MEMPPFENRTRHSARTDEHNEHCLTRSEVYALVREVINKRKHTDDTDSVCDHIDSPGFQAQINYIREILARTIVIENNNGVQCKRLDYHWNRFNDIFHKNSSLENEYRYCVNRNGWTRAPKYDRHSD
ncbi:LEF-11 [Buzura suppressaria nucleopolyhedrovirus]|uniref:Late expression factor 11 n=1 Tax=Buzura suppressaria nuclear polyhedrosis virus TaxID=74320 RepID=W5VS32_NPVBS|nr:LEF-11 [Buzura suppressaria nucleopolyhedrovirus]AHH82617.1 LEF-11 [Buzura suppressaria nucleopolyhedrovirus]AKN90998.1 LEF-11 [Buzura suppressaria nucleopolyhedrovirus]